MSALSEPEYLLIIIFFIYFLFFFNFLCRKFFPDDHKLEIAENLALTAFH